MTLLTITVKSVIMGQQLGNSN